MYPGPPESAKKPPTPDGYRRQILKKREEKRNCSANYERHRREIPQNLILLDSVIPQIT